MAPLTSADTHNMVAFMSKSDASNGFDQILDFLNAHTINAKRTAWNEFSCSMASVVICLATGRKFNFSKYIYDSMVRTMDSPSKFLMYPRFLQVVMDHKVDDMTIHNIRYTSPTLTKKVFANMRRVGKGFSGVETPLFASMLRRMKRTLRRILLTILPIEEIMIYESSNDNDDDDDVEKDEEDREEEEHLALADPSDVSTDDLVPSS
nr:hypothetical protein [Tanacetum cinerariifolium]